MRRQERPGSCPTAAEEARMKLKKPSSLEELQVASRFESLRRILLTPQYASHLEKPLAFWALPTDRRLPLALLGRALGVLGA